MGRDTAFCEGDEDYTLSIGALNAGNIQWSTGETTPSIKVNTSGNYWVQVFKDGCMASDTVQVDFNPIPEVDLGGDLVICEDGEVQLAAKILNEGAQFLWNTGDTTTKIRVRTEGKYWLTVANYPHCANSDTINLTIQKCICDLFVPSAFSPNQDGKNDIFKPEMVPETCPVAEYSLSIYNRWGQLVFNTSNFIQG